MNSMHYKLSTSLGSHAECSILYFSLSAKEANYKMYMCF